MIGGIDRLARPAAAAVGVGLCLLVAPAGAAARNSQVAPSGRTSIAVPDAAHRALLAQAAKAAIGQHAATATPPAGLTSENVEFLANLPELVTAISIAFIDDTAFVSTVHGVYSVDVSDPTNPTIIGALPHFIFENEHMTVDAVRKRLYISRDPRGIAGTTELPYGIVEIIDVSNPRVMTLVNPVQLPVGHTSTCINNCDYIWTGGPAASSLQPADWAGRPIFGTDVRDPAHPVQCPHAIDLGANDGKTDYAHSIDVDAAGVAWVSGRAHVRGFWTQGAHFNPVSGQVETATACDPIPYAGGGTVLGADSDEVMHNAYRNLNGTVDGRSGDVVVATEERTVTDCTKSGRLATYDIGGSHQGQGFINTATTHFRLTQLDSWTPENKAGSTGCDSAHWFTERADQVIAISFYSQGTRFLDTSDPRHIRQVGYFNPTGTNSWAAYWHGAETVFIADFGRGLDVVRLKSVVEGTATTPPRAAAAPVSAAGSGLPGTSVAGPEAYAILLVALLLWLVSPTLAARLFAAAGRARRKPPPS
ncbi:MAG: hypothetical protein QOK05_1480 [Chloroflexota bacterium]|jgi:hypothetical protein|nr:hypothetical protein [Chloroflexota bacterium]